MTKFNRKRFPFTWTDYFEYENPADQGRIGGPFNGRLMQYRLNPETLKHETRFVRETTTEE